MDRIREHKVCRGHQMTNLEPNVVGHLALLDQASDEVEVGVTGSGISNLDLFDAACY